MIAENKQGRIANQNWQVAFFVLAPLKKYFYLAYILKLSALPSYTDFTMTVKVHGINSN